MHLGKYKHRISNMSAASPLICNGNAFEVWSYLVTQKKQQLGSFESMWVIFKNVKKTFLKKEFLKSMR